MPFCEIRLGGSPAMSSPFNMIRPEVGRSTPVRQLKNVLLPAPFGPMIARISPRRISKLTLSSAVSPPKRTVSPSVRNMASGSPPRPVSGGEAVATDATACTLGELATGWEEGLFLLHHLCDLGLAPLYLEDELTQKRLMVLLAEHLVALREIIALLHFQAFERCDQFVRVLAAAELGLLHPDLERVHGLVV